MARTNVPLINGVLNSRVVATGTALDATNGHNILPPKKYRKLLLVVNNSAGAGKNLTVKAGVYPPALRQSLGDLVLTVPAGETDLIQIESGRFEQADGSLNIDLAAGFTGTIQALVAGEGNV